MVGEECELTVKTGGPKARQDTEAFSEDPSLFLQFSFVLLVHHAVLQCICLPLNILIITIPCAYPGSSSLIQSPNLTFHLSVCGFSAGDMGQVPRDSVILSHPTKLPTCKAALPLSLYRTVCVNFLLPPRLSTHPVS